MNLLMRFLKEWFISLGLGDGSSVFLASFATLMAISILAFWVYSLLKRILIQMIIVLVRKSKTTWDDKLLNRRFFHGAAHFAPAFLFYFSSGFAAADVPWLPDLLSRLAVLYIWGTAIFVFNAFLNAVNDIYEEHSYAKDSPIKGFIQLAKIIVFVIGAIMIVSSTFGKEPTAIFTGLGAMAAVIILVFKDTILGFVASIQLSANNMVKKGDWIEMPAFGADGTVEDITLTTVKVRNWDKTITTVPTYSLVSQSFNNWKGMEESGGRRIKRSLRIDMNSVCFCDAKMLDRFCENLLLKDYIEKRREEIKNDNLKKGIREDDWLNGRQLTNLGIFRKYLENYLHHHPLIHDEMTFLVRHLQPTEKGIPLEIYVFSKDQVWANYEAIQADIFDHVLAILPWFELKVFQNPTGNDFRFFKESKGDSSTDRQ